MEQFAARLWQEEEGQALSEYVLLLALISLMAVSAVRSLATSVNNIYSHARADLVVKHRRIQIHNNPQFDFRLKSSSSKGFSERNFKNKNRIKKKY